jgi:mono/diheme cytochrome c family protein
MEQHEVKGNSMKRRTVAVGLFAASLLVGTAFTACTSDNSGSPVSGNGDAAPESANGDTGVMGDDGSTQDSGDSGSSATAARGEYLVKHLLACGGCHNQPTDGGAFLGGGRAFPVTVDGGDAGAVYAANLTPSDAGLGSWNVGQIVDALTKGKDNDGKPLHPIMPYSIFGNLTADDATSIALYLKSLPPTDNVVPDRTAMVAAAAPTLDSTMVPHTTAPSGTPTATSAENGRYLAELGCIDCHTNRVGPSPDLTKAFAGGRALGMNLKSSNLTPDLTGIAGWTAAEVSATLVNGKRKGDDAGASLCPRMPSGPASVGGLTNSDRLDLGNYFTTLPPIPNGPFETDGGLGAACN